MGSGASDGGGVRSVGQEDDAEEFLRKALAQAGRRGRRHSEPHRPGADGLRAALELRSELPATGVLVLSSHYEEGYALEPPRRPG